MADILERLASLKYPVEFATISFDKFPKETLKLNQESVPVKKYVCVPTKCTFLLIHGITRHTC